MGVRENCPALAEDAKAEATAVTASRDGENGICVHGKCQYRIPEAAVRGSEMLLSLASVLEGDESVRMPVSESDFRLWYAVATGNSDDSKAFSDDMLLHPSGIIPALKVNTLHPPACAHRARCHVPPSSAHATFM